MGVKGEGTIFERPDRKRPWVLLMRENGKGRSWSFATKKEASAKRRQVLNERDIGVRMTTGKGNYTLAAWADHWLEGVKESRPASWDGYRRKLAHATDIIGHIKLRDLEEKDFDRLIAELGKTKWSGTTRRHICVVLGTCLTAAVRRRELAYNPFVTEKPKATTEERVPLTADETATLLRECADDRLGALIWLAVQTGARQGELLSLMWRSVDLQAGTVFIKSTLRPAEGKGGLWTIGPTKTRASRRTVPLLPAFRDKLVEHQRRQRKERLAAGTAWQDNGLVFTDPLGRPVLTNHLRRELLYPLLSRCQLPRVTWHDLRHTAGTLMVSGKAANLKDVQQVLGHANASTTLKYLHARDQGREIITAAMGGLVPAEERWLRDLDDADYAPAVSSNPPAGLSVNPNADPNRVGESDSEWPENRPETP